MHSGTSYWPIHVTEESGMVRGKRQVSNSKKFGWRNLSPLAAQNSFPAGMIMCLPRGWNRVHKYFAEPLKTQVKTHHCINMPYNSTLYRHFQEPSSRTLCWGNSMWDFLAPWLLEASCHTRRRAQWQWVWRRVPQGRAWRWWISSSDAGHRWVVEVLIGMFKATCIIFCIIRT